MCIASNCINQILGAYETIEKEYIRLNEELSKCDKMEQDILHFIELNKFDAATGWSYAKALQKIRSKRRSIKNELEPLISLRGRINTYRKNLNDTKEQVNLLRYNQRKNIYHPRVIKTENQLKELVNM